MMIEQLKDQKNTMNHHEIIEDILKCLAPLNRNIVSDEFEKSLDFLCRYLDLKIHRYKTGSKCWTWEVPPKWRIKDGYIKHKGKTIVSFNDHPLHVMSYSIPIDKMISGQELLNHIHVHKELPHAIPYEFSFYNRCWAFCLTHEQRDTIQKDEMYEVVIDSEFIDDYLSVGEHTIKGSSNEHIFFLCHVDHPCQVNDGLLGAAVNVAMAKRLEKERPYYNYTFLFVPETIGSIAYLSHNEQLIPKIRYAIFVEMIGLENPLILQKSYNEQALINSYALYALRKRQGKSQGYRFLSVASNDEKVFDGPGIQIPTISITRIDQEKRLQENSNGAQGEYSLPYPQYHSHLDNLELVNPQKVNQALDCLQDLVTILEMDFIPIRKFKAPIFLLKYNLWIDWRIDLKMNEKMVSLMYLMEGKMTAFQIAEKLDLDFEKVFDILNQFHEKGLIEKKNVPIDFDR